MVKTVTRCDKCGSLVCIDNLSFGVGVAVYQITSQEINNTPTIKAVKAVERVSSVCKLLKILVCKEDIERIVNYILSTYMPKKLKPDHDYTIWYNDTEPEGMPISVWKKSEIIESRKKFDLLVLRDETITNFFINGVIFPPPLGGIPMNLICYALKHKGTAGTLWNLVLYLWGECDAHRFRSLDEDLRVIKEALKEDLPNAGNLIEQLEGFNDSYKNRVKKHITVINSLLLSELGVKLSTGKNPLNEYEISPKLRYCLIEKVPNNCLLQ